MINGSLSPTKKTPVEFLKYPKRNSNEKRLGGKIIQIIKDSASEATTHGVDHIFKRDHMFIQLFWISCFIMSACACGYMIAQSIMDYLKYETVTKAEQIYLVSTQFPAVSICNQNAFMTNASTQFIQQLLVNNGLVNTTNDAIAEIESLHADTLLLFRYFAGTNARDPNRTDQFRQSLGYSMQDMLLSCAYDLKECDASDFEWYYDILYGNCYKFNNGKYTNGSVAPIRNITRPGALNGLTVELFLYEPTNPLSLAYTSGAYVYIENQTIFPFFDTGISTAMGTLTSIGIQRIFSSHLEKPYGDCTSDITMDYPSELVQAILSTGYAYSQSVCFYLCYERYLFAKCNCYDISINFPIEIIANQTADLRPCLKFDETSCNSQAFITFYTLDVQEICGEDQCPLECDSVTYNLFTSQAEYPIQVYAESLMKSPSIQAKFSNQSELTYDALKRNMVQISVFFNDLGYQSFIELEKMSINDLVASIGGTLGLFLGMSVLSFVELFDVFLQIVFTLLKPKKNNINMVSP